jgi:hypothetical protein
MINLFSNFSVPKNVRSHASWTTRINMNGLYFAKYGFATIDEGIY